MKKDGGSLLTNADKKLLKLFGNRVRQLRESKDISVYDLTGEDMPIRSRQHWQLIQNMQGLPIVLAVSTKRREQAMPTL